MKVDTLYALSITGLVVAAGVVGVATPALGAADSKSIDACRTISEPGVYELRTDLSDPVDSADACLEITSDNVVLDGNGHRVSLTDGGRQQSPHAVRAIGVENVTVTNLTLTGYIVRDEAAIRFMNVSDITIADVTVPHQDSYRDKQRQTAWHGITVQNASDVTMRGVDISGRGMGGAIDPDSGSGIRLRNVEDAVVRDGDVRSFKIGVEVAESTNVTITDMVLGGKGGHHNGQHRTYQMDDGVRIETSTEVTIRDSTINHTYSAIYVSVLGAKGGTNVIRNTTIAENRNGIEVEATTSPLRIVNNRIEDRIAVWRSRVCVPGSEGGELVSIHRNVFENDTRIENRGSDVVDATRNYWGEASGPSGVTQSDPDVPLKDPITGTLADGTGATISEFPYPRNAGRANVHFDPWLETPPSETTNATA